MRLGLIAAREARGWSQQYVATMIHRDRSQVAHYERGDCDIPGKVLQQLEALFALPMSLLLINTHSPVPDEAAHVF